MPEPDTQAEILTEASGHPALLASAPRLPAAARQSAFRNMLKNLLLDEMPAPVEHCNLAWPQAAAVGAWIAERLREAAPRMRSAS